VIAHAFAEVLPPTSISSSSSSSSSSSAAAPLEQPVEPLRGGTREERYEAAGCMAPSLAAATTAFFINLHTEAVNFISTNPELEHKTPSAGPMAYTCEPTGVDAFEVLVAPSAFPGTPVLQPSTAMSKEVAALYFPVHVIPQLDQAGGKLAHTLETLAAALKPALLIKAKLLGCKVGIYITDAMPVVAPANYALKIAKKTGEQPPGWGPLCISNVHKIFTYATANGLTFILLSTDLFTHSLGRLAPHTWKSDLLPTPAATAAAFGSSDNPFTTRTLRGHDFFCGWHPCAKFFATQLAFYTYSLQHAMLAPVAAALAARGVPCQQLHKLLNLSAHTAATAACAAAVKGAGEGVVQLAASLCRTRQGIAVIKELAEQLPPLLRQRLIMHLMYMGSGGLALKARMKNAAVAALRKKAGQPLSDYDQFCLDEQSKSGEFKSTHCVHALPPPSRSRAAQRALAPPQRQPRRARAE